MDFSNYKFRPSSLSSLMTGTRSKDGLSDTAKGLIQKCYISQMFECRDFVQTPPMTKGIMVESDTLDLIKTVYGETYFKNKTKYENDFIKGTPDVVPAEDKIIDVKSSWTIFTFAAVDEKKARDDYFWQLAGYAWMIGKTKGELIYGLVNTPQEIVEKEIMKSGGANPTEVIKNHTYDDIDPKLRAKRFLFDFTPEDFKAIEEKVVLARTFMNTMSL